MFPNSASQLAKSSSMNPKGTLTRLEEIVRVLHAFATLCIGVSRLRKLPTRTCGAEVGENAQWIFGRRKGSLTFHFKCLGKKSSEPFLCDSLRTSTEKTKMGGNLERCFRLTDCQLTFNVMTGSEGRDPEEDPRWRAKRGSISKEKSVRGMKKCQSLFPVSVPGALQKKPDQNMLECWTLNSMKEGLSQVHQFNYVKELWCQKN